MTQTRPEWADAMIAALKSLEVLGPRPLLPRLELDGFELSEAEFADFVLGCADENDAVLMQLRLRLAQWDSDASSPLLEKTAVRSAERRALVYSALKLGSAVAGALDQRIPVARPGGVIISDTFEPWYAEARRQRPSVYWDDYSNYLLTTRNWPAESVAGLDRMTTAVVERLADPVRVDAKATKGLVVGYVQSGKTANFTGVAAKAIDSGYRLVVVLTGTIEILREQTQRRMDMELVGRENILRGLDPTDPAVAKELDYQQDPEWIEDRFVRHGSSLEVDGVVRVDRVTTHRRGEYKRLPQGLSNIRFEKHTASKPLNDPTNLYHVAANLAVIKKNKAPLQKLINDLKHLGPMLDEIPLLVIDDESDQASVDTTNPANWSAASASARKRTEINRLITELVGMFKRAQYVGYTATPFANVFIDPDDARDLFPSDFVLSLDRPEGYMGVREFHDVGESWDDGQERSVATSNELAYVRALVGDPEDAPDRREVELQQAVDSWVLSGALKKFRETRSSHRFKHHTMLVHEHTSQATHAETADDLRRIWTRSGFTTSAGLARLEELYEQDFLPVMAARAGDDPIPSAFAELKPFIGRAIAEMESGAETPVLIVNSNADVKKHQEALDFEAKRVWRILVGGAQLSRGFTVEGLTTSYFRRRAGQADTLMQAGRWFGFRRGYQDLVRLFIRRDGRTDLYAAFEALLMDEEAFRDELAQYEGFDEETGQPLTLPRQIPPLVTQHFPWLLPTARNKMWNAVLQSRATGGRVQDLYALPPRENRDDNLSNLKKVGLPLTGLATESTTMDYKLPAGQGGTLQAKVGVLGASEFAEILREMKWHPEADVQPVLRFIENATASGKITDWAVVWPQPATQVGPVNLPGLGLAPVITRKRRDSPRIDFIGSDAKHRAAVEVIAQGGAIATLGASDTRGAVLIYLVDDRLVDAATGERIGPLTPDQVVPLLAIATPAAATPRGRGVAQWGVMVSAKPTEAAVDKLDVASDDVDHRGTAQRDDKSGPGLAVPGTSDVGRHGEGPG